MKEKIRKLYKDGLFPLSSLADFFANADGVNLNDNNRYYYKEFRERMEREGIIMGTLRNSSLIKSINGPLGVPSIDMGKPFEYAPENKAILNYIDKIDNNRLFINVHGTGGELYVYPVWNSEDRVYNEYGEIRDFKFYINNRLGSEYIKEIGRTYGEKGIDYSYTMCDYPDRITGLGDYLRKNYNASLLLELSKMIGNPIAPYGDRKGNYELTMISNFRAFKVMLYSLLKMQDLYEMNYIINRYGK